MVIANENNSSDESDVTTTSPVLRYDQRPADRTPVETAQLPDTPTRDRNIVATAWKQAPRELLELGAGLVGEPEAEYKRRIGEWLLWRAGPAAGGEAWYFACRRDEVSLHVCFHLDDDGTGEGTGPSGRVHHRFRSWKEDLLGRTPSASDLQ
jgi:hypothetical protein